MTSPPLAREQLTPRTLVAQYFRIWNSGEVSQLPELISADWVDHAHPERRCPTDVGNAIKDARKQNPELQIYIDAMLGEGDVITVNGRSVSNEGVSNWVWLVRIGDHQLQEMWTHAAD